MKLRTLLDFIAFEIPIIIFLILLLIVIIKSKNIKTFVTLIKSFHNNISLKKYIENFLNNYYLLFIK